DTPLGLLLQTHLGHRRQHPPLFMSELKEVPEGSERTVDGCSRVGLPSTRADRRELVGLPRADPRRRDVHERSPGAELRLELIQVRSEERRVGKGCRSWRAEARESTRRWERDG